MTAFADHIVYADESGSPVLDGADPDYPVFVLVFLLVEKSHYTDALVPALQRIKFDFVGHDQLILHERDIRRQSGDFTFLRSGRDLRDRFLSRINDLVEGARIELICSVIHKDRMRESYADPWSPYDVALHFCMERTLAMLGQYGQAGRLLHCVFESRGAKEDRELELTFRRIAANDGHWGYRRHDFSQLTWEPVFVDKKCNSAGLQVADLCARPIGLKRLRPDQPNRAYDIISTKIPEGTLKWFP